MIFGSGSGIVRQAHNRHSDWVINYAWCLIGEKICHVLKYLEQIGVRR